MLPLVPSPDNHCRFGGLWVVLNGWLHSDTGWTAAEAAAAEPLVAAVAGRTGQGWGTGGALQRRLPSQAGSVLRFRLQSSLFSLPWEFNRKTGSERLTKRRGLVCAVWLAGEGGHGGGE